jgi:hypothetical protein
MAMIYQVIYQFQNKVDADTWIKFYDLMKEIGDDWFHVLENVCWIYFKDDVKPDYILNKIMEIIDGKDIMFLITQIDGEANGWIAKSAWKWREKYIGLTTAT